MKRATLDRIVRAGAAGHTVVVLTEVDTGRDRLLDVDTLPRPDDIDPALWIAAREAAEHQTSALVTRTSGDVFLRVFPPRARLVIVGAAHIAQPLWRMAEVSGFEVTIIDPRRAFGTSERFPGARIVHDFPDDALSREPANASTAVVTLTHDPKLDDPALEYALRSPAFYVGALGSRKTHAQRLERLRTRGLDDTQLARIHAPIGLPLGGRLPAEIAVAILAEIITVRRGGA